MNKCIYKSLDELNRIPILLDGYEEDAGIFLHGFCDVFAIALSEILDTYKINHNIQMITNKDCLVHCFITIDEKQFYFIDVRGITNNKIDFFNEFADFFHIETWNEKDNYNEFVYKFNDRELFKKEVRKYTRCQNLYFVGDRYKKAKELILQHPENYII